MDLMVAPCLPIRLPACEAGTSSRVGPTVGAPRWGWSSSLSKPSVILLWTLSKPSTAGGSSASGSSFAEIITFKTWTYYDVSKQVEKYGADRWTNEVKESFEKKAAGRKHYNNNSFIPKQVGVG
jgi:hypothetical protein